MKAVITVIGKNKIGILAGVTNLLAEHQIDVLDITQKLLQDYFTMIMIVDLSKMDVSFNEIKEQFDKKAEELRVSIRVQHEDIFNSMHHI